MGGLDGVNGNQNNAIKHGSDTYKTKWKSRITSQHDIKIINNNLSRNAPLSCDSIDRNFACTVAAVTVSSEASLKAMTHVAVIAC